MAYVTGSVYDVIGSSSTSTYSLPFSVTDDVMFIALITFSGGAPTTPSGWTDIPITTCGQAPTLFYKKMGATPDKTVDITWTSNWPILYIAFNVRGAYVAGSIGDVIDVTGQEGCTVSNIHTCPSVTTNFDNSLLIFLGTGYSVNNSLFKPGIIDVGGVYDGGRNRSMFIAASQAGAAGATTGKDFIQRDFTGQNQVAFTLAIRDDTNGLVEGYSDPSNEPAELLHLMGSNGETGSLGTSTATYDPTTVEGITSIVNGAVSVTATYDVPGASGLNTLKDGFDSLSSTSGVGGVGDCLIFGSQLAASKDLSGELVCLTCNDASPTGLKSFADLGAVFGFSDGTNAMLWHIYAGNTVPNPRDGKFPNLIEVDGGFELQETGTFVSSSINRVIYGHKLVGSNYIQYVGPVFRVKPQIMIGGTSTLPTDFEVARKYSKGSVLNLIQNQGGQTTGQFFLATKLQVGNGTIETHWSAPSQSAEWPSAYNEDTLRVQTKISSALLGFYIKLGSSDTIAFPNNTLNFGDFHNFVEDASTADANIYDYSGLTVLSSTVSLQGSKTSIARTGATFSGCKRLTLNAPTTTSTARVLDGVTVDDVVTGEVAAIEDITTEAHFKNAVTGATFTNNTNAPAIRITGNQSHTGAGWDDPGLTVSGNTVDIEYTGTTDFTIQSAVSLTVNNSSTGTLTIATPVATLSVTSNETGSDIKIFTTGTQTVVDSTTGVLLELTAGGTYDITVQKAGFLPQRRTGIVLSGIDVDQDFTLVEDPIYNLSHGLTFTTDYSYNVTTRVMTIVAAQQGRDLYSALIDDFISESALYNKPFPIIAVGPDRFDFTSDGATAATIDSGDVQFWRGAGMDWEHATTGNRTHGYCALKGTGTNAAGTKGYYQQVDGAAPTALSLVSNNVDQVVQYYSDPNGDGSTADGYDRSGHLVAKLFNDGYYQKSVDVVDFYGLTAIESFEYILPMQMVSTGLGTGTRGITITVTDNTPAGVVEQPGYTFDYKVEGGASDSPEDLLRQWIFDIFTDPTASTYATKINFNWPDPIAESGGIYQTERGLVYGQDTTTTLHGFYVEEGADYHPDFLQQQSNDGTFFVTPVPTPTLIVNSDIAASDIKIFDANLQTVEASATGLTASTTTAGTYDITVMKGGYLPQRQTGITLGSESVTINFSLTPDPVYVSGHGLTWAATSSPTAGQVHYDESTRIMYLADNQEGRNIYSALIDFFIAQSALYNTPFPLSAVGPDRIDFNAVGRYNTTTTVGATIETNDVTFWKGAGMVWEHDTTGNPTKKFYSVKTSNTLQASSVVGYTQQNAGTPIEATLVSNQVNQVIQFFEDTNGDGTPDYEYTSHLLFKGFLTGYYQARWDVVNDGGITTLEPYEYTIALLQDAIAGATGDQTVTIATLTDHTAAPITVGSKLYDYELVDPGTTTGENLLSQLNYDVYTAVDTLITGTLYGYNAFDLPDLIIEAGANYETEAGYFEGDGLVTDRSGVYLSRGVSDHPDMSRFQSNDLTYYTPAVTANWTATNLPDDVGGDTRLQIANLTAINSSAWQATTAYVVGDIVLRTTGVGSENTAGLFFRCTTAGTTGGTEPTWVTTTPGTSTTSDGTVVWTVYNIAFYNQDPASTGASGSYINGEDFDTGESVRIRFAHLNGGTSFELGSTILATASSGFSFDGDNFIAADSVYATNAVDGSTVTKFAADYTDVEIDLQVASNFTALEAFAFYCYTLTTAEGMNTFWGGVNAVDSGNYQILTAVLNLKFDNLTTTNLRQTDTARIYADDESYPVRNDGVTTGGGGIDLNWKNVVYVVEVATGSAVNKATVQQALTDQGYTTARAPNLDNADVAASVVDGKVDTISTKVADIHNDAGLDVADPVAISGDGETTSTLTSSRITKTITTNSITRSA